LSGGQHWYCLDELFTISLCSNLVVCVFRLKLSELENIVGERVSALRKLKNNPHNKEALSTIFKVQQQVSVVTYGYVYSLSR